MDIVSTFLVNSPTGLWTNIINAFQSFLGNFALAIILLTICIKIVFLPLDFLNRKTARDNSRAQAKIAPEMAKIQKQYASDPNTLNQKRMELYKKNGMMSGGGCIVMLLYMVLTLVVFCTLFTGILSSNSYRQEQIYLELRQAYTQVIDNGGTTDEAKQAVLTAYDSRNSQFLWIQNVWLPDNPWTQTVVDFDGYLERVGDDVRTDISQTESVKYSEMSQADKDAFKAQYNETMAIVIEQRSCVNGYLLTTILAAGTAFLSQYIMQRKNKMATMNAQGAPGANKFMMILLPAIMGLITLFYNAIFGLYIIAMQLFSLATMPLFDKILDKMYAKKQLEEDKKIIMDYSRK